MTHAVEVADLAAAAVKVAQAIDILAIAALLGLIALGLFIREAARND